MAGGNTPAGQPDGENDVNHLLLLLIEVILGRNVEITIEMR
jgi:hypothetical protein